MIISIVNHTHDRVKDEEVLHAIRAINTQITEDFEPYWSMGARIVDAGSRLVKRGRLTTRPRRLYPRSQWSRLDVAGGEGGVKPHSSPSPSWRWRSPASCPS